VTFIKIINVDKNNKYVYLKLLVNVANVYCIYAAIKKSQDPRRDELPLGARLHNDSEQVVYTFVSLSTNSIM